MAVRFGRRGDAAWRTLATAGTVLRPGAAGFAADAKSLMGTESTWQAADAGPRLDRARAWQRGFHEAITRIAGGPGGSFQNLPSPGLAAPAQAHYGANLPRLAAMKRRLDPDNVFAPPRGQGITG